MTQQHKLSHTYIWGSFLKFNVCLKQSFQKKKKIMLYMEIQMLLKDHFNFIIRANYIVANVKEKTDYDFPNQ